MPLKNLDWSRWLYGLLSGFIGGGAGAVTAGLGAMGLAPQTFNLQAEPHRALGGVGLQTGRQRHHQRLFLPQAIPAAARGKR